VSVCWAYDRFAVARRAAGRRLFTRAVRVASECGLRQVRLGAPLTRKTLSCLMEVDVRNRMFTSLVFLALIPASLFSQNLQIGAGSIYTKQNDVIGNVLGCQFELIYKAQSRVAILSTFGHLRTNNFSTKQSVYSEPFTYEYLRYDISTFLQGDVSMSWFELCPIYYIYQSQLNAFSIYAGAGMGLYYLKNIWDWNTNSSLLETREQSGIDYFEKDIKSKLGYHIRMGFNLPATTRSKFCFEIKYLFYTPELTYRIKNQNEYENYSREINMKAFSASLALIVDL